MNRADLQREIAAAIGRHVALTSAEKIKQASGFDRIRILREAILDVTRDADQREEAVRAFALVFTFRMLVRKVESARDRRGERTDSGRNWRG